jgi:NAD(P)-dependent dehydrogenase (short-subunit alcohol dehydrogenase family)
MGSLRGRVAIVTGGSRGIGRAVVRTLAAEGMVVVATGRDPATGAVMEREESARPEVGAAGGTVRFLAGDVGDADRVAAVVDTVLAEHGTVDVLVNNAAVQREKALLDQTLDDFHAVVTTNLLGTFLFSRAVLAPMVAQGTGVIVNVSSVLGLVGDPLLPVYCATKAGILGLTRSTALAYAHRGIRVVAVCPGDVDTELNQQYFSSQPDPVAFRARIEGEYPVQRIASTDEIARTIRFLVSDDASFITGTHLLVDGGILSRIYKVDA